MNIILFLNKDLESNLAYNLLHVGLAKHNTRIYYSESVGNPERKPKDLLQLEYYEKAFVYNDVLNFIRSHGIQTTFEFFDDNFKPAPLHQCQDVNDPAFVKEVARFEPDLFLSIRFGKIFKEEIIKIPKKGILNLHSGILPHYRGILGTLHAMKDQRKTVGCTLHYISDKGIDTGEIIEVAELEVNPDRSLFWHVLHLYPLGCKLILKYLVLLEHQDRLPCSKQDATTGNYFSIPSQEDFDRLKALGFEVITRTDYLEALNRWISKEIVSEVLKANGLK